MKKTNTIRFDPRIFTSPPFIQCPKCGKQSFGVLSIFKSHYTRRCKNCFYPKPSEKSVMCFLPDLDKKIIYIDQFGISNMMKILNPNTKAHLKGLDDFWLKLFDKIYLLYRMQLIICPNSEFHTDESLVSEYYPSLKRMYELLSHNVSFWGQDKIESMQLLDYAENWFYGQKDKEPIINKSLAFTGEINQWLDKFIISLRDFNENWVEQIRQDRDKVHQGFIEVFKTWQSEKDLIFEDWYKREVKAYGESVINSYLSHLKSISEQKGFSMNHLFPPTSVLIFYSLQRFFEDKGMSSEKSFEKTIEFLRLENLDIIPFIRIYSLFAAGLARKAASGQKKPPNRGMANDISLISYMLPYCDAMFIDKECAALINENPIKNRIDFNAKIFSLNTKKEFLEYLTSIENSADKEHIQKLHEVYGASWRVPYHSIYQ